MPIGPAAGPTIGGPSRSAWKKPIIARSANGAPPTAWHWPAIPASRRISAWNAISRSPARTWCGGWSSRARKALEGPDSTTAKCAASAMVHYGRRRNGNELYGAYGHNLTFDEMQWLANWCLVRGQNSALSPRFLLFGPRPAARRASTRRWPTRRLVAEVPAVCRRLPPALLGEHRLAAGLQPGHSGRRRAPAHEGGQGVLPAPARLQLSGVPPPLGARESRCGRRPPGRHALSGRRPGTDWSIWPKEATPALERLSAAGRLIVFQNSAGPLAGDGRAVADFSSPACGEGPGVRAASATTPQETPSSHRPTDSARRNARSAVRGHSLPSRDQGRPALLHVLQRRIAPLTTTIRLTGSGKRQWLDQFTGNSIDAAGDGPVTLAPHELRLLSVSTSATAAN